MKTQNKYWFKRRRYGYGWVPVTRQGWLTVTLFVISLIGSSMFLLKDIEKNTYTNSVGVFYLVLTLLIALLIFITNKKGPKPKWRWGSKHTDDPKKDF